MPIPLIIVESPAKATAIAHFLGENYTILASVGHIADLPGRELGVQVHNNFTPTYVLTERGAEVIQRLQAALDNASALYIATDDDREGEAIAADLIRYLRTDLVPQRMVFQEITAEAIQHAINNPRALGAFLIACMDIRSHHCFGTSCHPAFQLGECRALRSDLLSSENKNAWATGPLDIGI